MASLELGFSSALEEQGVPAARNGGGASVGQGGGVSVGKIDETKAGEQQRR